MDAPPSSSSSCSLNAKEATPETHSPREDLFGTDSDDEPAVSRAESVRGQNDDGAAPEATGSDGRVQILPSQLEAPNPGFTEEGTVLQAEFELTDALELKFAAQTVRHETRDVTLFAPGELLDVELAPFDAEEAFDNDATYAQGVVRWRRGEDGGAECNSRLVEWDDGTFSLYVEGKWYDLGREKFTPGTELLCMDHQNCLQVMHAVESGFSAAAVVTDESEDEMEVKTVTEASLGQRKPKTKRVTVLGNPVKEREAKLRKIEEERRDRELMERKQRSLQERYTLPSLERLSEEDEQPRSPGPSAKRTRPLRRQPARKHKRVAPGYDADFVTEDEEEQMEIGDDNEEEEAEDTESEEEEEFDKEEEPAEGAQASASGGSAPLAGRGSSDGGSEEAEERAARRPVVMDEPSDDENASDE